MTHPKNNEYVKKWRQMNRDKYLEQHMKSTMKIYHYKQRVKELLRIDPNLFL